MTLPQRLGIRWFVYGVLLALFVLAIMRVRDIELLTHGADGGAGLVLGILATVQFGVIMPATCVLMRYHRERYNFWNALLLLLGFTVGGGLLVAFSGSYFFALLYVCISSGILTTLYLLTHALHRRMHETKNGR